MQPINSPFLNQNLPGKPSLVKITYTFTIPNSSPIQKPVLKKVSWFRKMGQTCEKGFKQIVKGLGYVLKYLGLSLLLTGTIYFLFIVLTFNPLITPLVQLVTQAVIKGAVPLFLAGSSLYFFGDHLIKSKPPETASFLNGFPIVPYFMSLFAQKT